MAQKILVIGGSGEFGSRLVRGLIGQTDMDVIIAGRDVSRAEVLARQLADDTTPTRIGTARIDNATVTAEQLRATGAFVVVDAAGPFQGNGGRLVRAAIAAGLHYVDLADGRDFVAGFSRFDKEARAGGIVALCGASSTPALSNAVLDRITQYWRQIDSVEIVISPGNQSSPRGLSMIRAILSFAGKPVRVFHNGGWVSRPGWGMLLRRRIDGLGARWLSLCETPDLDVVAQRFNVRGSVLFRAGLGLTVSHLGLVAASCAVRLGLIRSLEPHARIFQWGAQILKDLGRDRGGMVVEARGTDADGQSIRAVWTLIAEQGHGPFIPTLPALAAVRLLCTGDWREPGAHVCAGILPLDAIEREFAPYRIHTHVIVERSEHENLALAF